MSWQARTKPTSTGAPCPPYASARPPGTKPRRRQPGGPGNAGPGHAAAPPWRSRCSPPAALGRLPGAALPRRVLAGTARRPARPDPLPAAERRLDHRAVVTLTIQQPEIPNGSRAANKAAMPQTASRGSATSAVFQARGKSIPACGQRSSRMITMARVGRLLARLVGPAATVCDSRRNAVSAGESYYGWLPRRLGGNSWTLTRSRCAVKAIARRQLLGLASA